MASSSCGSRRFPPPWSAEETDACFIFRDAKRAGAGLRLFRRGAVTTGGDGCSFDHLVGLHKQRGRYLDPERLGGV
jgi:hypothetical protein